MRQSMPSTRTKIIILTVPKINNDAQIVCKKFCNVVMNILYRRSVHLDRFFDFSNSVNTS